MKYHTSVLLQEVINFLKVENGQKYIDATIGGGGHTREIINRGGVVLGLDSDQDAIYYVQNNFKFEILNFKLKLKRINFRDIDNIAKSAGFENVSGIIFDLGVSTHQIDTAERGFSYLNQGPLDMRMDQGLSVKASDLVNALGRRELYDLFRALGDEHSAHDISERIVTQRKIKAFETTEELVRVLARSYGFSDLSDFARATSGKKVFQALRIAVNDELGSLREALPKSLVLLKNGGRMIVITFHSLEDRIVKQEFLDWEKKKMGKIITKKPITATDEETRKNPRSKSAKLRVFERATKEEII